MSGIYVHIPFCKQACHYCNFHFSTQLERKSQLVDSIISEIHWRNSYLKDVNIQTIYFGGGTPSLLSQQELSDILEAIRSEYQISSTAEITLEANPDDLSKDKLASLHQLGINRLSIGVQSFFQEDLEYMNRSHNASQALDCIHQAHSQGFQNISIDLIYGSPTTSDEMWQQNVQQALDLGIPHLSCYALTVEPKTALAHFIKTQKSAEPDENAAARQFEYLVQQSTENNFLHYEISNFALPDQISQHNTNYWRGVPYIGIGPAAHSFDGDSRQWNVAHNAHYMQHVDAKDKNALYQIEKLSPQDKTNEYIMTALRTMWGLDLDKIEVEEHKDSIAQAAQKYIDQGLIKTEAQHYIITEKGKFLADGIASELFV